MGYEPSYPSEWDTQELMIQIAMKELEKIGHADYCIERIVYGEKCNCGIENTGG